MNKNNFIYDMMKNQNRKRRFVISTSAGLFNGQVEFPYLDSFYLETSVYDLLILKNGYLQQGNNRIDLDDTYVFVDEIVSISASVSES